MRLGRRAFVLVAMIPVALSFGQGAQGANSYNSNWNQTYSNVQMSSDTQSYTSVYHTTTTSTYNGEGTWTQEATVQRNEATETGLDEPSTHTSIADMDTQTCADAAQLLQTGAQVDPARNGYYVSVNHYTNTYTYNGQRTQTQTATVNRPADEVNLISATALTSQPSLDCSPGRFEAIELSGLVDASALNERGEVAGQLSPTLSSDGRAHAAIWYNGQVVDLGIVGCRNAIARCSSNALGLNNQGQAVGDSHIFNGSLAPYFNYWASFSSHETAFTRDGPQPLKTLGWYGGIAQDINNKGTVVGSTLSSDASVSSGDYLQHGFAIVGEQVFEIGQYGQASTAMAINDNDVVTGEAHIGGSPRAFRWANGSMTVLDHLGGGTARGNDIANAQERIVGISTTSDGYTHAALWIDDTIVDLGTLNYSLSSAANSTNDRGDIVGTSDNRAVLWRHGQIFDLNRLVRASSAGQLIEALDINNRGEILTRASNGKFYLLTPAGKSLVVPPHSNSSNNLNN